MPTIAGGRAVSEVEIHFRAADGSERRVPMAVFGDVAPGGRLEGMRIYFFYQWMPGASAYRKPIFPASDMAPAPFHLLTGVIRRYYEQLHNPDSAAALASFVDMAANDVQYGGYRPQELEPIIIGKVGFAGAYEGLSKRLPAKKYIRFETITDDGVNCLVEWTSIVRLEAALEGIFSQGGMAAYERAADGSLQSVRICDNVGMEADIDLSTLSLADNYIDLQRQDGRIEPNPGRRANKTRGARPPARRTMGCPGHRPHLGT